MAKVFLEGITVETLSDIIRETVQQEVGRSQSQTLVSKETDENYLTRKETAARLRVSLVTLTEWVNKSRLKAYKIEGRVLFRESEVEAALTQIVPLKHKRR
ncbi:MAG: helix-turn-helix domain-containing protein [Rikenellaceae bacterium]